MFFLLPQGVALSYALLPFQNEKILFRFVLRSVCTNFATNCTIPYYKYMVQLLHYDCK